MIVTADSPTALDAKIAALGRDWHQVGAHVTHPTSYRGRLGPHLVDVPCVEWSATVERVSATVTTANGGR